MGRIDIHGKPCFMWMLPVVLLDKPLNLRCHYTTILNCAASQGQGRM